MAHFAKLDENNKVLEIHIVANDALDPNDEENSGINFLTEWSNGYSNWKQTSYNNRIRKQYAGIGFTYDPNADVFISPQPFPSFILDENYDWVAPIPMPENGRYQWNEELGEWIAETL